MNARSTTYRLRARYFKALKAMTTPAPTATPVRVDLAHLPEPARLTILGCATVAGRGVRFGTLAAAPRLWAALAEVEEPLLGYVTGLVENTPELLVCDGPHQAWARQAATARELECAAMHVWRSCLHDCEG